MHMMYNVGHGHCVVWPVCCLIWSCLILLLVLVNKCLSLYGSILLVFSWPTSHVRSLRKYDKWRGLTFSSNNWVGMENLDSKFLISSLVSVSSRCIFFELDLIGLSLLHLLFDLVSGWLVAWFDTVCLFRLVGLCRILVINFRDLLAGLTLNRSLLLHGWFKTGVFRNGWGSRFFFEFPSWHLWSQFSPFFSLRLTLILFELEQGMQLFAVILKESVFKVEIRCVLSQKTLKCGFRQLLSRLWIANTPGRCPCGVSIAATSGVSNLCPSFFVNWTTFGHVRCRIVALVAVAIWVNRLSLESKITDLVST